METKNNIEADFVRVFHEHRTTIYTTCFLFPKDKEEKLRYVCGTCTKLDVPQFLVLPSEGKTVGFRQSKRPYIEICTALF